MRGGTLAGLFIGIVLGILIATAVVWFMNKTPVPFLNRVQPAPLSDNGNRPPLALPGKPGDPVPATPAPLAVAPAAIPAPVSTAAAPLAGNASTYPPQEAREDARRFIQAGSFTQSQDADKVKATLAMMGLEANVQQVMVQDKTHYRLRLGPYAQIREIDKVRAELAQAGIETTIIRE
jgi:cell division protein FtsN